MKARLNGENYLDLYKYFNDKAISVKGAMFTTITWIIGFAAALLAFVFAKLSESYPADAAMSLSSLVICACLAGMVICIYAFISLAESAKRIKDYRSYIEDCLKDFDDLNVIIGSEKGIDKTWLSKIWNRLRVIVALFLLAFILAIAWVLAYLPIC